jgi:hypothetical protein
MNCKSCTSVNQRAFNSDINVHFLGRQNLQEPSVFVFPKLLVCMDCGFTEFAIPETELRLLGKAATDLGPQNSGHWREASIYQNLSPDCRSALVKSKPLNVLLMKRLL